MPTLRPYQQAAVEGLRDAIRDGKRRILLVAPTGSGKGTVATHIIQSADSRGKRVLFLVNRRELVKDLSKRLDRLGLDHGVIMGNHWRRRPWLNVQVASIDTLHRRKPLPKADLLFLDEAHFGLSPIWIKVLDRYPGVPLIGMTATPIRLDGKGLGRIFNWMVECPSVGELTAAGHLVPARVFGTETPDLKGVHTQAGDFNQKELNAAVDKPTLTGDIVAHWLKLARGRPTVAFAVEISHSLHIVEQFMAAGIRAVHVDANTPDDVRDRTWADLARGYVQVVSSVGVISYGWDVPPVSCAILARPTQSLCLYLQQCGRVLRPHPGKDYALILDHAGNTARHGFVDDPREWSLEDGYIKPAGEKDDPALGVRMCPQCWRAFSSRLTTCPECGWVYVPKTREIDHKDGELKEITPERWYLCGVCRHKGRFTPVEGGQPHCGSCGSNVLQLLASKYDTGDDGKRKAKFMEFVSEAQAKGYKRGYPAVRFKQIFGKWPEREWFKEAVGA